MVRFLIQILFSLLANAIGLLSASLLLDTFSITIGGLVVATLLFTLATTILGPLVTKIALTNAPFLMGGVALVTTLLGLMLTTVITTSLEIKGISTWISATVIIWLFSMLASVFLPLVLFKKSLEKSQK